MNGDMRYAVRPRAVHQDPPFDDEVALIPDLSVDGPNEINTGLVSEAGDPIYRLPPPYRLRA